MRTIAFLTFFALTFSLKAQVFEVKNENTEKVRHYKEGRRMQIELEHETVNGRIQAIMDQHIILNNRQIDTKDIQAINNNFHWPEYVAFITGTTIIGVNVLVDSLMGADEWPKEGDIIGISLTGGSVISYLLQEKGKRKRPRFQFNIAN